jgi:hypothetical protein
MPSIEIACIGLDEPPATTFAVVFESGLVPTGIRRYFKPTSIGSRIVFTIWAIRNSRMAVWAAAPAIRLSDSAGVLGAA